MTAASVAFSVSQSTSSDILDSLPGIKECINLVTPELVAFSNTKGGTVYLGVEDDGEVTGCIGPYSIQNILDAVYDKTRPPLFVEAEEIPYKGKQVIALHVDNDGLIHTTTDGRCLKRLGKNNRPWYPEELSNRYSTEYNSDFSSKVITESSDLDIDLLEIYKLKEKLRLRDRTSTLPDMDDMAFLKDLGLIIYEEGTVHLTIAGLLFVGKETSIKKFLPQAEVIYLKYKNESDIEYNTRLDLKQPIITILDRLTENNIITHASSPRNKLIAETLQRLKYVQRTGQGVDIIYKETVSMGKPYPIYRHYNDSVQLTIYSSTEDIDFVKFIIKEQESKQIAFSLAELMILRFVKDNRSIIFRKAVELTQVTEDEARNALNRLQHFSLLETVGNQYMLTARVYDSLKSGIEYTQDHTIQYLKAKRLIIEYLEKEENITRANIQELCGYNDNQARRTIEKLKKENIIQNDRTGRYANYKLVKK